jgi:two-component system, OmpR family, sensor histidine kinase KdpD
MSSARRSVRGTAVALGVMAVLTVAMIPLRSHLSVATDGLILIIPVVAGVVSGGFGAGVVSVIAGFLVYDFVFTPPYYTPWVGSAENWVAPGVYLVVMLLVARVVAGMAAARVETARQKDAIRKLFELSNLLVGDKPLAELLGLIVSTLRDAFELRTVAVLLPASGRLEIAASAGEPLDQPVLDLVVPAVGADGGLPSYRGNETVLSMALTANGRPIGYLVLCGTTIALHEREPFLTFANQTALAVERSQLREEALRAKLLEEVGRLAKSLVAAVSHDLRTPLASIKMSASTLSDPDLQLAPERRQELAQLIDHQADRLARLAANLLDMGRIQAGVLEPRRELVPLPDLITEAVRGVAATVDPDRIRITLPHDLPLVDIDRLLIGEAVFNLLENAARHAPAEAPIVVAARDRDDGTIELSVSDSGPGVPRPERSAVFGMYNRREADGGAGLGLAIAKAFVEAHGETIWVEDAPGGGARFCMTLSTPIHLEYGLMASGADTRN